MPEIQVKQEAHSAAERQQGYKAVAEVVCGLCCMWYTVCEQQQRRFEVGMPILAMSGDLLAAYSYW